MTMIDNDDGNAERRASGNVGKNQDIFRRFFS